MMTSKTYQFFNGIVFLLFCLISSVCFTQSNNRVFIGENNDTLIAKKNEKIPFFSWIVFHNNGKPYNGKMVLWHYHDIAIKDLWFFDKCVVEKGVRVGFQYSYIVRESDTLLSGISVNLKKEKLFLNYKRNVKSKNNEPVLDDFYYLSYIPNNWVSIALDHKDSSYHMDYKIYENKQVKGKAVLKSFRKFVFPSLQEALINIKKKTVSKKMKASIEALIQMGK